MARTKMTADRIREFTLPAGKAQAFLWDSEAPGLGVRATAGAKSFIFQGKLDGKDLRITIGSVDAWPIESKDPDRPGARQEARRLQTMVDRGIDPRTEKAARKEKAVADRAEADRQGVTFREAWDAYVAAHKARWSAAHIRGHEQVVAAKRTTAPLAGFLELKLNEITAERVRAWMDENAAQRPTFTGNAFRKLRAFINWCNDDAQKRFNGLIDPNVCGRRIARDLPKAKPKTGSLQREQLAVWFAEVRKLSNPVIANYLQILLLTGARREELATLTWEHVDLRWGSMIIRDKVEGERQLPITPYVAQLLRELKAINETPPAPVRILHGKKIEVDVESWQPSPWVFFSKTADDGRMVEPRIGHNRALKAAGLPALTLHDLRRSFSNLSKWVEVPVGVVAQLMGHKPSATAEKHYKPRPLDLLRMWHTRIEAWILEQAGIEQPHAEQKGPQAVPSTTAA